MSKFNTGTVRPARGNGPVTTEPTPTLATHEGAPAFERSKKGELFMLAVSNMVGEDTFYEKAAERDARFAQLVRAVAVEDVDWMVRFIPWLRTVGNMRSASLVAAAEAVAIRLANGLHGSNRALIAGACNRADEPGELLAYWMAQYGRALPKPVKRGIADAAMRLYAEYPLLKYDTGSHAVRFADVLELCHPGDRRGSSQGGRWRGPWQGDLFEHAIDRRHGRDNAAAETLRIIRANAELRKLAEGDPQAMLDTERLHAAGMTWEDVLSLVGSRVPKAELWAALIPVMGIDALAKNLRNFDEAGVPDSAVAHVIARFSDPAQVARSRMFPYRWLAAYQAAPSLRWGHPLDQALTASLGNLPAFTGRTLVLVDVSPSMTWNTISGNSKLTYLDAAAVFGVALAARGDADLVGFATNTFRHPIRKGASVIEEIRRFAGRAGEAGGGTCIAAALREMYAGHDRVVIVSDQQTMGGEVTSSVPAGVALYGFNLAGYRPAMADWGATNRIELGGLTDATFRMIPLVESGRRADWPF